MQLARQSRSLLLLHLRLVGRGFVGNLYEHVDNGLGHVVLFQLLIGVDDADASLEWHPDCLALGHCVMVAIPEPGNKPTLPVRDYSGRMTFNSAVNVGEAVEGDRKAWGLVIHLYVTPFERARYNAQGRLLRKLEGSLLPLPVVAV